VKEKLSSYIIVHWILSDPLGIEHLRMSPELLNNTGPWLRNERSQKYHALYWATRCHNRQEHSAGRVRNQHHVADIIISLIKRFYDGVGISCCTSPRLTSRQAHRQDLMPAILKLRDKQFPTLCILGAPVN